MSPIRITAVMLEKLLNLYFREFPTNEHDLQKLSDKLNANEITVLDIVEACSRIVPELGMSKSPLKVRFEKLVKRKRPFRTEALRAVLFIHKELQKTEKRL
jgi:hypothetical protein